MSKSKSATEILPLADLSVEPMELPNRGHVRWVDFGMWVVLFVFVSAPTVFYLTTPQPGDVLQEVRAFRGELLKSRDDILERTKERLYFEGSKPNIWELIDANELEIPEGWTREEKEGPNKLNFRLKEAWENGRTWKPRDWSKWSKQLVGGY